MQRYVPITAAGIGGITTRDIVVIIIIIAVVRQSADCLVAVRSRLVR